MGIYQRKQKLETNDDAGKCYLSDSIHFMKQYMAELTFTYTIPVYEWSFNIIHSTEYKDEPKTRIRNTYL